MQPPTKRPLNRIGTGLATNVRRRFFSDLSIAECYGAAGVRDTYARVIDNWMDNLVFIIEFIVCLGLKASQWAVRAGGAELQDVYSNLFENATDAFYDHYEGNEEACDYFFQMTD